MPDIKLTEQGFLGLDESTSSRLLPPGYLSQADNVIIEGGEVRLRPGVVSQLASVITGGVYVLGSASDGSGDYLLIAANGKIRRWNWGGSSTTLPTGQTGVTVAPASVQAAQGFGMFWLVDGTNPPRSYDGSSVESLVGLDAPDSPALELSYQTLIGAPGSLTWSQNFITGNTTAPSSSGGGDTVSPRSSITQADSNFWDSTYTTGRPFWTKESNATCSPRILTGNGDHAVELDSDSGTTEWIESGPMKLNDNALANDYAKVFVVEYEAATEDTNKASEVVDLIVQGYTNLSGTSVYTPAERRRRSPFLPAPGGVLKIRELIDWRGMSVPGNALRSFSLRWEQPYNRTTNAGAMVNRVACYIPSQKLEIVKQDSEKITIRQGTVQVWAGSGSTLTPSGALGGKADPAQSPPGRLLTAGLQTYTDLGSSANWTSSDTLALELTPGAGVTGLSVRLGLRSGGTVYWTQTLDTSLEEGWGLADMRDIQTNLSAVDRVIVEIREDVLIENLQEAGTATICTLGALRSPGNLASARRYWYRIVEIDDSGDSAVLNTVESEGCKPSAEVIPSYKQRRVSLRLPAKKNATATHRAIYRFGGGLIEDSSGAQPIGRLIGIIPFSASTFPFGGHAATGVDPHVRAIANPYLAYTHGASDTLVDNTPDGWLFGAETFRLGREKPPATPSSVAVWNRRVWLSTASEVFGSWLVDMQQPAALYWSRIVLPQAQDPRAPEKGFWVRLPLLTGDSIVRLWPRGQSLLIFCERGVWTLTGTSFEDYRLEQISPFGLAAPRGICEHRGQLYWLTHDGLMQMGDNGVVNAGLRVRQSLPPLSGATASAYATSSLISTPNELIACVPANSSSSSADTALVLGVRSGAWTRWPSLSLTSGAMRPETPFAALGTVAGQISLLQLGSGDGTGTTNISAAVATRPLGDRVEMLRPHHLGIDADVSAGQHLTLTVTGDDSGEAGAKSYQFNPIAIARFRVSRCSVGRSLTLSVSAATYGTLRLRRLTIEAIPFSRRNY